MPDKRSRCHPGVELTDKRKTAITRLQYDPNHRTTVYGGIGYSDAASNQNFPTAVKGGGRERTQADGAAWSAAPTRPPGGSPR